jgi:hypothetical protein
MISDVEGALPKSGALNLGEFTAAVVRIELEIWYTNFAPKLTGLCLDAVRMTYLYTHFTGPNAGARISVLIYNDVRVLPQTGEGGELTFWQVHRERVQSPIGVSGAAIRLPAKNAFEQAHRSS